MPGWRRVAVLGLPLLMTGCGGDGMVPVTGKLLKGGTKYAVPEGQRVSVTLVALETLDATGKPAAGGANEPYQAVLGGDGESFTVPGRDGHGVPPGKYRIAVGQKWDREAFEALKKANPRGKAVLRDRDSDLLEERFSPEKSPIVREVPATGPLTIDLDQPTGS